MKNGNIHIRGWGAVTALGWGAEGARRLIAGDVHPAGVCGSAHLVNREFKGFEVACDGNPWKRR